MTPDFKRLTIAAAEAHDAWFGEPASITPAGAEEIVRAVLTALREPSDAVKKAAEEGTEFYGSGEYISYDAVRRLHGRSISSSQSLPRHRREG